MSQHTKPPRQFQPTTVFSEQRLSCLNINHRSFLTTNRMKIGGKWFSVVLNWAPILLVSKSMAFPTRWPPLPKASSEMPTVIKIWHLPWAPNLLLISPCWNVSQLWEDVRCFLPSALRKNTQVEKLTAVIPKITFFFFFHLNYPKSSLLPFSESVCLISPKRISIHSPRTFCFYKPQEEKWALK